MEVTEAIKARKVSISTRQSQAKWRTLSEAPV